MRQSVLDILRQRSAWGTCIGQSSINYYLYFLVTWLPFYLVRSRHMSLKEMANAGGLLFPWFPPNFIRSLREETVGPLEFRRGASATLVRKEHDVLRPHGHWRFYWS